MGGIIYALLIGAVAGWLAGKIMKGGGFGALINIILGIVGGAVGNWLFGTLGIHIGSGIVGDLITGGHRGRCSAFYCRAL